MNAVAYVAFAVMSLACTVVILGFVLVSRRLGSGQRAARPQQLYRRDRTARGPRAPLAGVLQPPRHSGSVRPGGGVTAVTAQRVDLLDVPPLMVGQPLPSRFTVPALS